MNTLKGMSGSTLKWIAIGSMLIDHTAAALLGRLIKAGGYQSAFFDRDINLLSQWLMDNVELYSIYTAMRYIGRIAFPIYCFLLVEGFLRTRNVKKYVLWLGAFALISEVPFDLAFRGKALDFAYQNVFFTLLFGLLTMIVFRYGEELTIAAPLKWFLCGIGVVLGAAVAEWLSTDYGAKGVLCIMVLYLFRKDRHMQILAGCASFLWEWPALFGFIPIACYNGRRGMKLKYFFYAFYPLHLSVLYLIAVFMGVGRYTAW